MRVIFMGTPEIAVPVLGELHAAGHDIAAVYTRMPKPRGRGHQMQRSPVHRFAEDCGLEVRTPKNFKQPADCEAFAALGADVAVVIAYGLILPKEILEAPLHGCLNLHASLLPRWRGAAPIHRAIMAGDLVTGVQVMRMEAGLDTGPILLSETIEIRADDTAQSLHDRMAGVAAQLAPRSLAALERGGIVETPQSEEGVTYAEKITPAEAKIDWSGSASNVDWHIRGLSPFPGAWFDQEGRRVKVLMSRIFDEMGGEAGIVLRADDRLVVACGDGAVELITLQRSGKKQQNVGSFLRGVSINVGDRL